MTLVRCHPESFVRLSQRLRIMNLQLPSHSTLERLEVGAFAVLAALAPVLATAQVPLISFAPLTPTTITVPIDAEGSVAYELRNNGSVTRSLAMTPIQGVHQVTSGAGSCTSPFTLPPAATCDLELRVVGNEIGGSGVNGGPKVCVASNPLACYQPAAADALDVTVGPASLAVLDATPRVLVFAPATTANIVVTNSGNSAINAQDIQAHVANGIAIIVDSGSCAGSLAPGMSCNLLLSADTPQPLSTLVIGGTNTNLVDVDVTVTDDLLFAHGFE
jgi:hypothetical protein